MKTQQERRLEKWDVSRLRLHPKQQQCFGTPSRHEIEDLAADLKKNGQLVPVEALPDGTILTGHKRLAAALTLGWTAIQVWVRDDLAGSPAAAETRLIMDNVNRRQLGPLELARAYRRLKQLATNSAGGHMADSVKKELRDQIGERLNMSGRSLDRYLRVLEDTPQEVQDAVAANRLPVTTAERVAGLTKAQRQQIAEQIRAGGDARKVVGDMLRPTAGRHKKTTGAVDAFVRSLARGVADLEGRVATAPAYLNAEAVILLDKAVGIIGQIRARAIGFQQDMRSADDDGEPTAQGDEAEATDDGSEEHVQG